MERSVSESLLDTLISHTRVHTDTERYELFTTPQTSFSDTELDTRYFEIKGSRKRKLITFQNKWLMDYTWLRYYPREIHKGGWCLPCCLFLTDLQKEHLGAFVKSPFVNYNKANEVCKKQASKEYHVIYTNPWSTVASQLLDVGAKIFKHNSEILPPIVETVLTCSRQRLVLQGHSQDKIDFSSPQHNQIYSRVKKLASEVNCEEKMPCIHSGRQTRTNPAVGSPSEY